MTLTLVPLSPNRAGWEGRGFLENHTWDRGPNAYPRQQIKNHAPLLQFWVLSSASERGMVFRASKKPRPLFRNLEIVEIRFQVENEGLREKTTPASLKFQNPLISATERCSNP